MRKIEFVMLRKFSVIVLITVFYLFNICTVSAFETYNVTLNVMLIDQKYDINPVKNFKFDIHKTIKEGSFLPNKVIEKPFTSIISGTDGSTTFALPAGVYAIKSNTYYELGDYLFEWDLFFTVKPDDNNIVDLTNANAIVHKIQTSFQKQRPLLQTESFDYLMDGVVKIETDKGLCTGFIVDSTGLIATNYHILKGSTEVRVIFDKNKKITANIVAANQKKDIAILYVNLDAFPKTRVLPLAEKILSGSDSKKVVLVNYPYESTKTIYNGILKNIEDDKIITDIGINYDNAGAPLFNSAGEVIGINVYDKYFKNTKPVVSKTLKVSNIRKLISEAKRNIREYNINKSSKLLKPNDLCLTFPLDALKNAVDEKFNLKNYIYNVDPYRIILYSPPLYYNLVQKNKIEKEKLKLSRKKYKNKKEKFILNTDAINPYSTFEELKLWSEAPETFKPYLIIEVIPMVVHTEGSKKRRITSFFLGTVTGLPIFLGYKTLKFKKDFYEMTVNINGVDVEPVRKGRELNLLLYDDYFSKLLNKTHSGLYYFDPDILNHLNKDKSNEIVITIYDKPEKQDSYTFMINDSTIYALKNDFAPFFNRIKQK